MMKMRFHEMRDVREIHNDNTTQTHNESVKNLVPLSEVFDRIRQIFNLDEVKFFPEEESE